MKEGVSELGGLQTVDMARSRSIVIEPYHSRPFREREKR